MVEPTPRIEPPPSPSEPVRLLGEWTAAQFAERRRFRQLRAGLPAPGATQAWDLREASQLDHVGAQLLWDHWQQQWPAKLELLPAQRAVLERVAQFTTAVPALARPTARQLFLALGGQILHFLGHIRAVVALLGQLAFDVGRMVALPHTAPWRDLSGNLYRICASALPITALVGLLIGVVLAYLTARQLHQFGADAYIINILGIGLIRELGPMLAAILIAGRSGSAITAQIGVMRVTEELDAMSVMGISHSYRLVLPRALALAIGMPLISVWTTLCALAGGMVISAVQLDITPTYFLTALPEAVPVSNLVLATCKAVVFGILIALVGCHFGLRVEPNTDSLGRGTTSSVVTAITVVILVDALFAIVFKDVGG
ncbi:ABC transporter permease [Ramlibacter sp.]|uniref:MlaE family ABC transporter permease n=1 Tax=Ramlibacter sp. TaxID=1917967 RepID=UPI0017FAFCFA|nr:ABC transporter permease [Ramlibacter sp.]MBA2675300.1 ABC transporter permease [Ramlibacter sp.]